MTENNVMEFCQWLVSKKGIDAGNLSEYINNNEEEVLKLAEEFKKPKFKIGGKIEVAAEMFKCGGKAKKKKPVKKCETGGPQKIDKDGDNYSLKHTKDGITEHLYLSNNYEGPASKIATRTTKMDGSREYSLLDDGVKYHNNDLDTIALRKQFDKAMATARNVYPSHKKWGITPWEISYMAAPEYDLPMRPGIVDKRVYRKVESPSGELREYVVKSTTGERTERRTTPDGNVSYIFSGKTFKPGDEMFDRYQSAFKAYGLQKGGEIVNVRREKPETEDRKNEYKNANPINYIEGYLPDGRKFEKSSNFTYVYDDDIDEIMFRVRENGDSVFSVYPTLRDYNKRFLVFQDNGKWKTSAKLAEPTYISNLQFKDLINRLRESVKNVPSFKDAEKIK